MLGVLGLGFLFGGVFFVVAVDNTPDLSAFFLFLFVSCHGCLSCIMRTLEKNFCSGYMLHGVAES